MSTLSHSKLPIISGTEFLHDGKVPTYPLASVGSVETSALQLSVAYSQPFLSTIYGFYYTISGGILILQVVLGNVGLLLIISA